MDPLEEGIAADPAMHSTKRDFLKNRKRITDAMNMNLDNNSLIDNADKAIEYASVMIAREQAEINKTKSAHNRVKTADRTTRTQRMCETAGTTIRRGTTMIENQKNPYESIKMTCDDIGEVITYGDVMSDKTRFNTEQPKGRRILPRERRSNEMKSLINEYKFGNVNRRKGTGFNQIQLKYP